MATELTITGVDSLETYFTRFPGISNRAASMAINTIATRDGMRMAVEAMEEDIAFPRGYARSRLQVTKRANTTDLEAVIVGRKRATSLARFASGQSPTTTRGRGVRIRVNRNKTRYLKEAFLVRLRKGASLDEDNYNIGLAVRLGPGETLSNKRYAHRSWLVKGQVALLYGPSVDQLFRTVAPEIAPQLGQALGLEFIRQFNRLSRE